ncbi:hypothetical protein ABBQ32_006663 [Trebouxia sp. C0010 RCD-2024]
MVYTAPSSTSKRAFAKSGKIKLLDQLQTSSHPAEAQAADAKHILARERQALRQAKQATTEAAAAHSSDDAPFRPSQEPQASLMTLLAHHHRIASHVFRPRSTPI